MTAAMDLCKTPEGILEIFGKELENGEYVSTISQTTGKFTYLNTVTINQIQRINAKEEVVETTYQTFEHKLVNIDGEDYDDLDVTRYKFPQDGLYKVSHLILPTKEWLDEYYATFEESPETSSYNLVVYYDNGLIYIHDQEEDQLITLDELFQINVLPTMSLFKEELFTFSTVDLHKCLYKINNQLLHQYCPINCEKHADPDLIWKRDLLRMALYVIKYELELKLYFKAQITLEDINGCTPFCDTVVNNNKKHLGCGCGSKA